MDKYNSFGYAIGAILGIFIVGLIVCSMNFGYNQALKTIIKENNFQYNGISYHVIPSSYY